MRHPDRQEKRKKTVDHEGTIHSDWVMNDPKTMWNGQNLVDFVLFWRKEKEKCVKLAWIARLRHERTSIICKWVPTITYELFGETTNLHIPRIHHKWDWSYFFIFFWPPPLRHGCSNLSFSGNTWKNKRKKEPIIQSA